MPWGPELRRGSKRFPLLLLLVPLACAARPAALAAGPGVAPEPPPGSSAAQVAPTQLEAARRQLERAAEDLEPGLRGRALLALVAQSEAAASEAYLQRALWDPNEGVRRQAAFLVATDPARRASLLAFFARKEVPAATRCLAARRLLAGPAAGGEQGRAEVRAALGLAAPGGPEAAAQACQLLAAEAGDAAAAARLLDGLSRGWLRLDMDLVLALADSALPGLGPAAEQGLARVDELARGPAGLVLLGQGSPRGSQVMRQALSGPEAIAGMEAVDLLVRWGDPAALPLLAHAEGVGDPRLALYARLAASAFGAPDARALRGLADTDDGELIALGLGALALGLERQPERPALRRAARRVLRDAARSERLPVRVAVADLVGVLGEAELLPLLHPLEDEEAPLRLRVAVALAILRVHGAARRAPAPAGDLP